MPDTLSDRLLITVALFTVSLAASGFSFILARVRERAKGRSEGVKAAFNDLAAEWVGEPLPTVIHVLEAQLRRQLEAELRTRLQIVFGNQGRLAWTIFWFCDGFMFSLLCSISITSLFIALWWLWVAVSG